jgi:hypothetical protein
MRTLNRIHCSLRHLFVLAPLVALSGCSPSPEEACKNYVGLREKDGFSTEGMQKECEKSLATIMKVAPQPEAVPKITKHGTDWRDIDRDLGNIFKMGKDLDGFLASDLIGGIASESAGQWAKKDSDKPVSEAECDDAAPYVAMLKARVGLIGVGEYEEHQRELARSCAKSRKDPAYAKLIRCLRRADDQKDLILCTTAPADSRRAQLVEGCLKKCKDEPDVRACSKSCQEAGGR